MNFTYFILFDEKKICIQNNINLRVANIDAGNDFSNVSTDFTNFNCELEKLNPVKFPFND